MFKKTAADRYHESAKALEAAEQRHQVALDALDDALQARMANDVPRLRIAARETESALAEALRLATEAHRAYWLERRTAMEPMFRDAVRLFREFNQVARRAGDVSCIPALTMMQAVILETAGPVDILDAGGVPAEGPDSELIRDKQGSWRGAGC